MSSSLRLMSFNPAWQQEFEQTKSSLLQATEGWVVQCEHIGSTCLDGAIAQPIVDVVGGLREMQGLNEAATLVEGLNFRRLPAPRWCEDELVAYLEKPRAGAATHSVLLVRVGGETWNRVLAVRERLANNVSERQQFENVKKDHYKATCDAPERYAAGKDLFFEALEQVIDGSN